MYKFFPKADSFVCNSLDLVNKLSGLSVGDDYSLVSLDAISLFTNIPIDKAIDSISKRWHYMSDHCSVPKDEFIIAV